MILKNIMQTPILIKSTLLSVLHLLLTKDSFSGRLDHGRDPKNDKLSKYDCSSAYIQSSFT